MATHVVIHESQPWPPHCAVCGQPSARHRTVAFSGPEPMYRVVLGVGVLMGLLVATWMMVRVRPNITHELPAVVSFVLLFLSAFGPVWLVASFAARHRANLDVPLCAEHADAPLDGMRLESAGDEKIRVHGLPDALVAAFEGPPAPASEA